MSQNALPSTHCYVRLRTVRVALQEIEAALEAEESKVTRAQLELTQYKQEAEKRIADKDEELENMRKNHARQLESLQSSLETEIKAKSDLVSISTPSIYLDTYKLFGILFSFNFLYSNENEAKEMYRIRNMVLLVT